MTKLNTTATALIYSTYLGGSDNDSGRGIAVDGSGSAYITGQSNSTNFPTTAGAYQTRVGGGIAFEQARDGGLHQTLGVGAGVGGDLRKLTIDSSGISWAHSGNSSLLSPRSSVAR